MILGMGLSHISLTGNLMRSFRTSFFLLVRLHCSKVLKKLGADKDFEHEHASIGIFDILIKENNLMPEFNRRGLFEPDIHFIKELILGSPDDG